ncbi:response regulator [Metabacillus indicus]|uniref:response regulator n=1 Tax=Metabacillus indicus TaxID=246786 RepID=UPI002491D206|nr:response regulator [Metabacillus indicus]
MWKAVIIDDDRQILRIMKKTIPWEQLSLSCAGEGADGEEGLRLIKEHQPDIVITDIYMPIMNGMEMLQKCRDIGFEGKVIILSGYSDFEYARTALRLNVHDYLSKPVSMETIESVLKGAIKKLEEEQSSQSLHQNLTRQLEFYQALYESAWIKSIVVGMEDPKFIEEQKENLQLENYKHQMVVLSFDVDNSDNRDIEHLMEKFKGNPNSFIARMDLVELSIRYTAVLLKFDHTAAEEACMGETRNFAECMLGELPAAVIGIGKVVDDWREISLSTEEALRAAEEEANPRRIRSYNELAEERENLVNALEFIRPVSFYQEMSETIKHNQYESTLSVLKKFVEECKEEKRYLFYHWKRIGKEAWIITTFSLHDNGIKYTEIFEEKQIERQIEDLENEEQFQEWLSRIILNVQEYQELNDKENRRHKQAVDYMIQYIYENYEQNITLNELSEQVFISRNYLSQIFKKATGHSFNYYLTKVRMEKAKQMILEGNLLIYEIAEKVGFKNTPYFSSLFKKYMGVNPTDLLKK